METNYCKNLDSCSKGKVVETNYSKNLDCCSKGKVVETNYSKNKASFCSSVHMCAFSNTIVYSSTKLYCK